MTGNAFQNAFYFFNRKDRRSAATEVNGVDFFAFLVIGALCDFAVQCLQKGGFLLLRSDGIESAIGTFRVAERNMDVDACHFWGVG